MTVDGILAEISIEKLLNLIGGTWENALKKNEKSYEAFFKIFFFFICFREQLLIYSLCQKKKKKK